CVSSRVDRGAQGDDRAARLHAPGFPGRLRVPGSARSRRTDRAGPNVSRVGARLPHFAVRAAAQRAVETRTAGGGRRGAERARIVSLLPPVDAAVGTTNRRELVGGAALSPRHRTHQARSAGLPLSAALRTA